MPRRQQWPIFALVLVAAPAVVTGCRTREVVPTDKVDEAGLAAAIESREAWTKTATLVAQVDSDAAVAALASVSEAQATIARLERAIADRVLKTAEKDSIRNPYLVEFIELKEGVSCKPECDYSPDDWCPILGTRYIYDTGHFDVGVGFGGAVDLLPDNGSDDDVLGAAIVLKAYPLGRWWAAVPSSSEPGAELEVIEDDLLPSLVRRLNFFVGVSLGDFGPDDDRDPKIHGLVYIAGIAYDIAPQFAVAAGLAFVEVERDRGMGKDRDTEVALYVGILMNAEAMLAMFDKQFTTTQKTRAFSFDSPLP